MSRGGAERAGGEESGTTTAVERGGEGATTPGGSPVGEGATGNGGPTAVAGRGAEAANGSGAAGGTGAEGSIPRSPLTRGDVFEVLSNRRRRLVFEYLQDYGGRVDLAEISKRVAAMEEGSTPEEIRYADRKSVHTALYQFHLPKMQSTGFVDYDRRAGRVALTPAARTLDVTIETAGDAAEPNWPGRFLALSTIGGLLAGASWLDLVPGTVLPDAVCAVLVAALFLGASVAFARGRR